jgi:hypothetical protein
MSENTFEKILNNLINAKYTGPYEVGPEEEGEWRCNIRRVEWNDGVVEIMCVYWSGMSVCDITPLVLTYETDEDEVENIQSLKDYITNNVMDSFKYDIVKLNRARQKETT